MKCLEEARLSSQEEDQWFPGVRGSGAWERLLIGTGFFQELWECSEIVARIAYLCENTKNY